MRIRKSAASTFCRAYRVVIPVTIVVLLVNAQPTMAQRTLGLDVSYWQGAISQSNWNEVYNEGNRKFVIIRSSRGGTTGLDQPQGTPGGGSTSTLSRRYDDPRFVQNMVRATQAGLFAGAYHFARPDIAGNTGDDEAIHFIQVAGAWMRPGYLPPMFDLEAGSGGNALATFAIAFSERIYAEMQIRPSIYINGNYSSILQSASASLRNQLAQPVANSPSVVGPAYPTLINARYYDQDEPGFDPEDIPVQTGSPKNNPSPLSAYYGPWDDYGNSNPWSIWQYASVVDIPGLTDGTTDGDVARGDIEFVKDLLIPAVWMNDNSGDWSEAWPDNKPGKNWNSGKIVVAPQIGAGQAPPFASGPLPVERLPGAAGSGPTSGQHDTVILERPNANITVTISTGTHNIRKMYMRETLNITGGTLIINYDPEYNNDFDNNPATTFPSAVRSGPISAQFSGAVTLSGTGSLNVNTLLVDAGQTFTLAGSSGTLTFNSIDLARGATPGKIAITGNVNINPLTDAVGNATAAIVSVTGSSTFGSIDLSGGTRTLSVSNGAADVDLNVAVAVTNGGLTKSGAGTMQLTGTNTFTGPLTIAAGTLSVATINATAAANQPLGNSAAAISIGSASNGTLRYTGAGAATLNRSLSVDGAGGATIRATAGTLTLGSTVVGNGNAVTFDTAGGSINANGAIGGTGTNVTKTGTATLALAGTNTYTGNTIINGGVLQYSASANLGSSSNSIVFGGGTLRTLAAITETRGITLNAAGGTIDTNALNSTFSGNVTGTGAPTKIGTGTLTLGGTNNNFGGLLTINDGIVKVTANNQLGTAGVITNMTVVTPGSGGSGHGGTLQLSGNVSYNLPLTIGGGGLNGVSGAAPGSMGALDNASDDNTWSGPITFAGTGSAGTDPLENQIGAQAGTLRLTGVVQNASGVNATWVKTGNGDVVLGGGAANTYSGLTRVFGGRLILEKDGALGTAGSSAGTTGNTFQLSGSASTIAFRAPGASSGFNYNTFEVINTHGTGAPGLGQVDNLGGDNSFAGSIAFDGPTFSGARQGSIGVSSGSLTVSGGLYARGNDGTPRNLTKLGGGTLILTGNGGAATGDANVAPLANSTFNVNAGAVEMRGPSLSTANLPGVTTWNVASGATLVASTGRFSTSTVNVNSGGTFNLTGGSTDLATLNLTGGGSFGFTGGTLHAQSVQGSFTNQGGMLAPGNSPGTTAIAGSYTQQSGGLEIEIGGIAAGTNHDVVTVTAAASLAGTLNVSLIDNFTPTPGQEFIVLTANSVTNNGLVLGGPAAGFFNLLVGASEVVLQAALLGDFNRDNTVDMSDYVVWRAGLGPIYTMDDYDVWRADFGKSIGGSVVGSSAAVPEPATIALIFAGLLPMVFCRRLRRRG